MCYNKTIYHPSPSFARSGAWEPGNGVSCTVSNYLTSGFQDTRNGIGVPNVYRHGRAVLCMHKEASEAAP